MDRKLAYRVNPFIGTPGHVDTMSNVIVGLRALETLSPDAGNAMGKDADYGYSLLLGCMRAALDFEVGEA